MLSCASSKCTDVLLLNFQSITTLVVLEVLFPLGNCAQQPDAGSVLPTDVDTSNICYMPLLRFVVSSPAHDAQAEALVSG